MAVHRGGGNVDLEARALALCHALGYAGRSTFYDREATLDQVENGHLLRTAFEILGAFAVFGVSESASSASFKPVVLIGCAASAAEADAFHRQAWTQGAMPLVIVVHHDVVEVRNGFAPPGQGTERHPFAPGLGLASGLAAVDATALTNSLHWRDFVVSRETAIDTQLVDAIQDLNLLARERHEGVRARTGLVNALIGRFVYLYVLVDRGVVDEGWMTKVIKTAGCAGHSFAAEAVRQGVRPTEVKFEAEQVWAVLRGVDRAINGSVFPISRKDRLAVPPALMHLIHRVLRCGDVASVEGRQISFLDVSFGVIRTETISAIYEQFVTSEGADLQRSEGAFYTPPFLVDHVLTEVERERPLDASARVMDCAAGSGAFLVAAYRRIMRRSAPPGGWGPRHAATARDLLSKCIFGIEKNRQAANVCRFSLYLTLLDYVGRAGIEELAQQAGGAKLFPRMSTNVSVANAFAIIPREPNSYTHVIGNPPWLQAGRGHYDRNRGTSATARRRMEDPHRDAFLASLDDTEPVGHGRTSDLFAWLAIRSFLSPGGTLGLVLPTKSLVGRQSGRFSSALASTVQIRFVSNLSHLRYHLFQGSRSPATVVIARKDNPRDQDVATVYRPRLSSLPLGRSSDVWALLVAETDIHRVRARELRAAANGWQVAIMLGSYDRRMHSALADWARQDGRSVGEFLKRSALTIKRGGSPGETGIDRPSDVRRRGQNGSALLPLSRNDFVKVAAPYKPLFSAGVVLVPRTFRKVRILDEPHSYPSTYYGIAPRARWPSAAASDDEAWDRATTTASGIEREGLLGLIAFLQSGVAAYFASIFGAAQHLEDARFEKGDLAVLPCPFANLYDARLRSAALSSDPDRAILDAMGAGADLRAAVDEFVRFNKGYLDGQLPSDAFELVGPVQIESFRLHLERELRSQFTEANAPHVSLAGHDRGCVRLDIGFGLHPSDGETSAIVSDGAFVASSAMAFDLSNGIGSVVKSEARFAWTFDQAVADADAMARLVRKTASQ